MRFGQIEPLVGCRGVKIPAGISLAEQPDVDHGVFDKQSCRRWWCRTPQPIKTHFTYCEGVVIAAPRMERSLLLCLLSVCDKLAPRKKFRVRGRDTNSWIADDMLMCCRWLRRLRNKSINSINTSTQHSVNQRSCRWILFNVPPFCKPRSQKSWRRVHNMFRVYMTALTDSITGPLTNTLYSEMCHLQPLLAHHFGFMVICWLEPDREPFRRPRSSYLIETHLPVWFVCLGRCENCKTSWNKHTSSVTCVWSLTRAHCPDVVSANNAHEHRCLWELQNIHLHIGSSKVQHDWLSLAGTSSPVGSM